MGLLRAALARALLPISICVALATLELHVHASSDAVVGQLHVASRRVVHLALRADGRRVFVAAVNRLLELDSQHETNDTQQRALRVLNSVSTGPLLDSVECPTSGCPSDVPAVATDAVPKLLLLLPTAGRLLRCSSVRQGACWLHRLDNISRASFVDVQVAANDEWASTVGFLGPERYQLPYGGGDGGESLVLYVAATFTTRGPYRHNTPAIASRLLPSLEYAEYSFTRQSLLTIDVKYRDHFLVQYVAGFSAGRYAYFLGVQKRSHLPGQDEVGFRSRVGRVCVADANYDSYAEVTVACGRYDRLLAATVAPAGQRLARAAGVSTHAPVLVAAFAAGRGNSARVHNHSAVCVYPLSELDYTFTENIHMCFNGSMRSRNLDYISGPIMNGQCPQAKSRNIADFCDVALKLSGESALTAEPVLQLPGVLVTSLAVTTTGGATVAFLGTRAGSMVKAVIESPRSARHYETIELDSTSIGSDIIVDTGGHHVFLASHQKVFKVRVQTCHMYTDCEQCLSSADPYCGWCSLEKRCTVQSECRQAELRSPRWLTSAARQQCIDFEQVTPDRVSIDQMSSVRLIIRTLPALPAGAQYRCVFAGPDDRHDDTVALDAAKSTAVDARVTPSGLVCDTPPPDSRPSPQSGADHVLMQLAVRSSETNKDFVARPFVFFDCSRHSTCRRCVEARWPCNWCVHEHSCTSDVAQCRHTAVHGRNSPVRAAFTGSAYCPVIRGHDHADIGTVIERINSAANVSSVIASTDILLADGERSEIPLLVDNLPLVSPHLADLQCVLHVEAARLRVPARVEDASGRVICAATSYNYQRNSPLLAARLTLSWRGGHELGEAVVLLYKCGVLGSHRGHADCSLCVTRPPRFSCAWCDGGCRLSRHCQTSDTTDNNCPRPRIDLITPLSGPVEGGTLLTIEGSNLGVRADRLSSAIFVGDAPCQLVELRVSVRIVCRTPAVTTARAAKVRVRSDGGEAVSAVPFNYRRVQLTGVRPMRGPVSGGTRLTLSGAHLTVGSQVRVWLDEQPCRVAAGPGPLTCMTAAATGGVRRVRRITVAIDAANRSLSNTPFSYADDPTVLELRPLRSPVSGGRTVLVHGTNLDTVQTPYMLVYSHSGDEHVKPSNVTACHVLSASMMRCPSPSVPADLLSASVTMPAASSSTAVWAAAAHAAPRRRSVALPVGFIMDAVSSVRRLPASVNMVYVADPQVHAFAGGERTYGGDTLVIEGARLNAAADESDLTVTIGRRRCNVTSLARTQLVCWPQPTQPPPTDDRGVPTGRGLPLVVVRVGDNLRFPLGHLRYVSGGVRGASSLGGGAGGGGSYRLPAEVTAGVAAAGLLLVLVSAVVLLVYRRRSSEAEREYKRIQIQMDTLESHVRMECKQAFAELQTDITDLTADLQSTGIPMFDHRTFVMNVLFPGVTDHPVLHDDKTCGDEVDGAEQAAMLQFEQLLHTHSFLLTFVDVLESQRTFNIRDKVNFASLLMVALMTRMDYATETLRLLLLRLIERSVAGRHPQLMLRRTESVVEKLLTNWLALCLYEQLRADSSASLFLLTAAVKHQVEKGPVDAMTHDARYSLSDDRLLRQQINYAPVTIRLIQEDPHYEKIPYQIYQTLQLTPDESEEKVQCRVLDCDSISQVKAKILDALYKNTPFSLRPSIHDIDLEWRHGRGGHLVLADQDLTSKVVDGWRRINTLAHYGIKDSACMSLRPRVSSCSNTGLSQCSPGATTAPRYGGIYSLPSPSSSSHAGTLRVVPACHLVRPPATAAAASCDSRRSERHKTAVPEIFLTRLLSTKGTVHKYVDDLFASILRVDRRLPPAVKWLLDLLDEAARVHAVAGGEEVARSWKANALPLRFWVNFIKNPDFLFDIDKSATVDSCLTVVAQTFMDACSTTERRLSKDSPSSKLLFAKDLPVYRARVARFYSDVTALPTVTDSQLTAHMQRLSAAHVGQFATSAAVRQLFDYAERYGEQLATALTADDQCRRQQLAGKLAAVQAAMLLSQHQQHQSRSLVC